MFWERQSAPQEPEWVGRAGYFKWGKAIIRQLYKHLVCCLCVLREGEHVARVVTKLRPDWAVALASISLAEHTDAVAGSVAPGRPWNKNMGLWWEEGFRLPPGARGSRREGSLTWLGPLRLSLSAKAFSLVLATQILLPQGVLQVHGKANCESRKKKKKQLGKESKESFSFHGTYNWTEG